MRYRLPVSATLWYRLKITKNTSPPALTATRVSRARYSSTMSEPDMMGYHTIIYGHHMRDGSMFANLVDFKDADYFEKNSQITLYTPERTLNLTVIAAYAQSASDTAVRQFEFADDADFHAFADGRVKLSQNKREGADKALASADRLYTFITCSYEGDDMRTIVHAIEIANNKTNRNLRCRRPVLIECRRH